MGMLLEMMRRASIEKASEVESKVVEPTVEVGSSTSDKPKKPTKKKTTK